MLLHRLLAALVLIPLVISTIYYSTNLMFLVLSLMLMLLIINEWSNLHRFNFKCRAVLLLAVILPGFIFYYNYLNSVQISVIESNIYNIVFITSAMMQLYLFTKVYSFNRNINSGIYLYIQNNTLVQIMLGILFILPFWFGLCYLKFYHKPIILVLLFLIVWSIDSGAYFIGKSFGRTKLIPEVSPGKTWEGIIGGLLFLFILNFVVYFYQSKFDTMNWGYYDIIYLIIYNIIIFIYSVFGDLTESMIKRIKNVKDSGSLIPGHGGLLDRLDSIITVIPVYCLIIQFYY